MLLPHTYAAALALMVLSMLCWGSWANTLKLCPGYRFQLFYWDYAIGMALGVLALGFTAGSLGHTGVPLLADAARTAPILILYAALGGAVFNVANLLLVNAIDVAGLAVAFPVGIGLALVIGAVSNYVITPVGNPLLLFGGVALVVVAILLDAAAYRKRETAARGDTSSSEGKVTTRGIVLSLVSGVLMGCFYPFVARALNGVPGQPAPGPYAVSLFFTLGLLISTVPANGLLMIKPLDGKPPVEGAGYMRARFGWHIAGILGGAIWCVGGVSNFVASGAHLVGPAVSYTIGQGATMVSASWGIFVWHEFASAPAAAKRLLFFMFVFFLLGLGAVALAPLY